MNKLVKFIKVTLAGGILFLIPMIVLIVVVAKAMNLLKHVSKPLAERLGYTQVAGIGLSTLISIFLLLVLCFLAGLLMRTPRAKQLKTWLETSVLVYIPGYSYLQALSTDKLSTAGTSNWKPATILVDDNEVVCFVIDETEHYCSIFLPSAPTPSSGSVCVREKRLVRYLPINVAQASLIIRKFGKGAADVMEKTDLSTPEEK